VTEYLTTASRILPPTACFGSDDGCTAFFRARTMVGGRLFRWQGRWCRRWLGVARRFLGPGRWLAEGFFDGRDDGAADGWAEGSFVDMSDEGAADASHSR